MLVLWSVVAVGELGVGYAVSEGGALVNRSQPGPEDDRVELWHPEFVGCADGAHDHLKADCGSVFPGVVGAASS